MRLKISAGQLKEAVKGIWPSVGTYVQSETRYFNPVLLRVKDGALNLYANQLTRFSWARVPVDVGSEGELAIPGGVLRDIGRVVEPESEIEVEYIEDDNRMELVFKEGSSVWRVHTMNADQLNIMEPDEKGFTFKLDLELFRSMISEVAPAVSGNSGQFVQDAIEIKREIYEDEKLDVIRLASCDGHRIHIVEADIMKEISVEHGDFDILDGKGILVDRSISKYLSTLPDEEEAVEVSFAMNKSYIVLKAGMITHGLQLMAGKFAPYEIIIDKFEPKGTVRVNRKDFSRAVKSARALGEGVSLILSVEEGELIPFKVQAVKKTERGKKPETVYCEVDVSYEGEPFDLNFNPRYISDGLGAIQDVDEVDLVYGGGNSPLVIKHPERYFRSFIMPVAGG